MKDAGREWCKQVIAVTDILNLAWIASDDALRIWGWIQHLSFVPRPVPCPEVKTSCTEWVAEGKVQKDHGRAKDSKLKLEQLRNAGKDYALITLRGWLLQVTVSSRMLGPLGSWLFLHNCWVHWLKPAQPIKFTHIRAPANVWLCTQVEAQGKAFLPGKVPGWAHKQVIGTCKDQAPLLLGHLPFFPFFSPAFPCRVEK